MVHLRLVPSGVFFRVHVCRVNNKSELLEENHELTRNHKAYQLVINVINDR